MNDNLGTLKSAREELRKQFISYAEVLTKGFDRSRTYGDIEQIIKLREAIDALDHAIEKSWSVPLVGAPHTSLEEQFTYEAPESSSRDNDLNPSAAGFMTL
jgi:hypothetical protein